MSFRKADKHITRDWSSIYKVTNPIGQVYIGVTSNPNKRFTSYKSPQKKTNRPILLSFAEHGDDAHKIEIIDTFRSDLSYAYGKEIFFIKAHMSNSRKYPEMNGLNRCDGGAASLGVTRTDEFKKFIGDFHRGKKLTPEELTAQRKRIDISCGKKILQFDLDGNFIKEYPMIETAAKEIGIPRLGIQRNLSGQYKQSRVFVFKYKTA